ncbi:MAG: sodium:proline symporter [Gammaproteobacteria bacterium]|jgi:sodium/proline symporter|nr:sodium:proline symporter [Gammaproteobacteria bacterium]
MTASFSTVTTFSIYLIIVLLLGWGGFKATNNLSDYILGGRRLNSFVTALSAGASDMSGWLLMGLPGAIFLAGISQIWIATGLIIGAWLNWHFVAARLRLYTEKSGNSQTLPDFLSNRFEDTSHVLRIVSTIAILIFFTLYCSSGIVAGARLFEGMFGISYTMALWIGALITIMYVFMGGFLAISWTDTVQASLIITALIVTPLAIIHTNGGLMPSIDAIKLIHPTHTDLFNHLTLSGVISLLAWGLGYFGQPHILVRFMAAKSVQAIPAARRISMAWMIFCLGGAVAIGFFGSAYFALHMDKAMVVNANPESIFMEVAKQLFNPWITGFLLAAILAVIMSSLSCQLLVCSSALTEDIYKTFVRPGASERELVWCGRLTVLLVACIAIALASNPQNQILKMVSYAWAGFGAAFGPVVLLSLIWPRMTRSGALAGIITGTVTVLLWKHYAWFQLYEIVPGFIFASLAIVTVSKLSQMPAISIKKSFDSVENEIEAASV